MGSRGGSSSTKKTTAIQYNQRLNWLKRSKRFKKFTRAIATWF
jgi:hypothetical protein